MRIRQLVNVTSILVQPKNILMLISIMRMVRFIEKKSLNLNLLFLNISKSNTISERKSVKFVITLFNILQRTKANQE